MGESHLHVVMPSSYSTCTEPAWIYNGVCEIFSFPTQTWWIHMIHISLLTIAVHHFQGLLEMWVYVTWLVFHIFLRYWPGCPIPRTRWRADQSQIGMNGVMRQMPWWKLTKPASLLVNTLLKGQRVFQKKRYFEAGIQSSRCASSTPWFLDIFTWGEKQLLWLPVWLPGWQSPSEMESTNTGKSFLPHLHIRELIQETSVFL